ncbi:hypothetical protein [Sigmofec virus UA08Rod_5625]|uniref:Uncharacterized protein n=1 Tax=Sigmofec virus UA08Rod_5625 TaxID=2929432 RepID=A0A976R7B7_9VIRU|nr:hypothetical protein [Sigmofec virus UA08Rod_5625]
MKYRLYSDDDRCLKYINYSQFSKPPVTRGEVVVGESMVSVANYIDQLDLISQMIEAGETLSAIRIATAGNAYNYDIYDASIKDSDIVIPRSRMRDFDLVDLGQLQSLFKNLVTSPMSSGDVKNEEATEVQVPQGDPPSSPPADE